MMTDIVERLRAWHTPGETVTGDVQLYLDAADEIEWLRAVNAAQRVPTREQIAQALYQTLRSNIHGIDGFYNAADAILALSSAQRA